jgi:hypothetical protein
MSENELKAALESVRTDARYAREQIQAARTATTRTPISWGRVYDHIGRAVDALERIVSNAEAALRPADVTPAAGSCEHCPGHGGGCIVCDGIQAKPEGGR